jgi:hypothetical protein
VLPDFWWCSPACVPVFRAILRVSNTRVMRATNQQCVRFGNAADRSAINSERLLTGSAGTALRIGCDEASSAAAHEGQVKAGPDWSTAPYPPGLLCHSTEPVPLTSIQGLSGWHFCSIYRVRISAWPLAVVGYFATLLQYRDYAASDGMTTDDS